MKIEKRGFLPFRGVMIWFVLLLVLSFLGPAWAKPVTPVQVRKVVGNWLSLEPAPLGAVMGTGEAIPGAASGWRRNGDVFAVASTTTGNYWGADFTSLKRRAGLPWLMLLLE